jgi:hypothetical protein
MVYAGKKAMLMPFAAPWEQKNEITSGINSGLVLRYSVHVYLEWGVCVAHERAINVLHTVYYDTKHFIHVQLISGISHVLSKS